MTLVSSVSAMIDVDERDRELLQALQQAEEARLDLAQRLVTPVNLAPDVSLCLFRILQEALHNIAKHSHATKINIELDGTSDSLRLTISDNGVGFVQNNARLRPGLGLISMRERLHLIGGRFVIKS